MNATQQQHALAKFRTGEANVLVATDIAQEGLDVPECSYVIRYDFVSNEIGRVQSRGTARADKGKFFLITYEGQHNFYFKKVDLKSAICIFLGSKNQERELENREKETKMDIAIMEWMSCKENVDYSAHFMTDKVRFQICID